MKISKLLIMGITVFSLCSCKWFEKEKKEEPKTDKKFKITVPVTTSPSVKSTLTKYVKTSGTAKAIKVAVLNAEVAADLEQKHFTENSKVSKNQLLFTLDEKDIKLKLDKAQLELERSQAEFNAWKKLSPDNNVKALEMQTGLADAKININELKRMLDKTKIVAPFNGFASYVKPAVGQKLNVGDVLCKVFDLSKMQIKANVLESEIDKIKVGNEVLVKFPAIENEVFKGKLKSISPFIETASRTCEVIVEIDNNGKMKDGMFAEVKIAAQKIENQVIVHKNAILKRDGRTLIFTAKNNLAKWQYVTLGEENDKFICILEGAEPEQEVIIDGNFSLSHDADIEVTQTISYNEFKNRF